MSAKNPNSIFNSKKLATKINALFICIILFAIFSMLAFNYFFFRDTLYETIEDECLSSTFLLEQQLTDEFAPTSEEDIQELLDNLKESTNNEYTIFNGDTREYTTIVQNGERILGTALEPEIAEIVLVNGENYIGHTEILGVPHLASYSPHRDASGNIVGVLFAGRETSSVTPIIMESSMYGLMIGLALIIVSGIIGTRFVKYVISQRLNSVVETANALSNGNFAVKASPTHLKDEIGVLTNAFSNMHHNLSSLQGDLTLLVSEIANNNWQVKSIAPEAYVGDWKKVYTSCEKMVMTVTSSLSEVSLSADQISADSDQIAQGAQQLAAASEEQSASVESLSMTLNDVSNKVSQNLENSKQAAEIARESGEVTNLTLDDMKSMQKAMTEISTASENISKIVKVIDDISFQTNILALNASVEAARAGSAGSGFAVVADEVRNLAQKSADAAKDITQLIDHSIESVQNGVKICDKANVSFEELAVKVNNMVNVIDEISVSSEQQNFGVEQIAKEIKEISSAIHHNSATSEESAASSQQLAAQAGILNQVVSKFKI